MNLAAKVTAAFFDSHDIRYSMRGDDNEVIRVGFRAENKESVEILLFFSEKNDNVGIRSFDLCKVPEAKKPALYELCSKLNDKYRWVKFYIDEDDNTITAADDAVIQLDSCGEECLELVMRMCDIADEVYPEIMKTIWS